MGKDGERILGTLKARAGSSELVLGELDFFDRGASDSFFYQSYLSIKFFHESSLFTRHHDMGNSTEKDKGALSFLIKFISESPYSESMMQTGMRENYFAIIKIFRIKNRKDRFEF